MDITLVWARRKERRWLADTCGLSLDAAPLTCCFLLDAAPLWKSGTLLRLHLFWRGMCLPTATHPMGCPAPVYHGRPADLTHILLAVDAALEPNTDPERVVDYCCPG